MLSHVLLTPLSGIVLWCDMLRAKGLPEPVERGLLAIDRSARVQVAILDNLVELGLIRERSTELYRCRVELGACMDDVVVRSASAARQREVKLHFEAPRVPRAATGDPARLRVALHNVVENAINACARGGRVDVVLHERSDGGSTIRVTDEGDGIAPALLPRLFTIDARLGHGLARRGGHLGLGLPVARRIVELHGGTLSVENGPARGCVVTIGLPPAGSVRA